MIKSIIVAAITCLFCQGCDSVDNEGGNFIQSLSDRMSGCYSITKGGEPEIKLTKSNQGYYGAIRKENKWEKSKKTLRRPTDEELSEVFGSDSKFIEEALVAQKGAFGLFRVREGADFEGTAPDSAYIAIVLLGGGPVYPVACN